MLSAVQALAGLSVAIATFTIALILNPAGVAAAVAKAPVAGPLLVTDCYRCDTLVLRARAEEMPVESTGPDPMDALTITFCDECSRTMTSEDRLDLLHGEAERREDDHV